VKTIILAGGLGSRLSEETALRPKPMVEIGGKPILWHIMNIYACYGIDEFIIALGYKGEAIKEYFLNFYALNNDVTLDLATGGTVVHDGRQPRWKVHLVDTGASTQTGGRVRRLARWLGEDRTFMMTYGDGVADIDIAAEIAFNRAHGKQATVTAVQPPGRYGALRLDGARVDGFIEKPRGDGGLINGGFFVLSPRVIDRIDADSTSWEQEPLAGLAKDGELMAYVHGGFWQPMDTLRERNLLEELWQSGRAPWKRW